MERRPADFVMLEVNDLCIIEKRRKNERVCDGGGTLDCYRILPCDFLCKTYRKKKKSGKTYESEGIAIGMCMGVALGTIFEGGLATGISVGMLLGLCIGSHIQKKDDNDEKNNKE